MELPASDDDRPVDPKPVSNWLVLAGMLLLCLCYFVVFLGAE